MATICTKIPPLSFFPFGPLPRTRISQLLPIVEDKNMNSSSQAVPLTVEDAEDHGLINDKHHVELGLQTNSSWREELADNEMCRVIFTTDLHIFSRSS